VGGSLISIRTLRPEEAMPQHLGTGYESMPVMNEFVWIAEQYGKIIGIMLGAPCHGLVFIVRVCVERDAPSKTVHLLFRHFVQDCEKKGLRGYFTFIDPSLEVERKFIPICHKAGGMQVPMLQVGLVGSIEKAARF
jgi:hypothetical protein